MEENNNDTKNKEYLYIMDYWNGSNILELDVTDATEEEISAYLESKGIDKDDYIKMYSDKKLEIENIGNVKGSNLES